MTKYQLLFIIEDGVSDEEREALIAKFSGLIENLGGAVAMVDKWGTRKFAYEIDHKNQGYYVHMHFDSNTDAPAEIDRQMRINDKIVRQMITTL